MTDRGSTPERCSTRPGPSRGGGWRFAAVCLIALTTTLVGCDDGEHLSRHYGQQGGALGRDSVNGTAVLAKMFRDAGHRVIIKRALTPSLGDADVLVWFPDDFEPPSEEVVTWLEEWLYWKDGGILIYVDRNFDAAIPYWDAVIPRSAEPMASEMRSRRNEVLKEFGAERTRDTDVIESRWYNYDTTPPRRRVTTLSGPWSEGIDASQTEIELYGKISPGQFDYEYRDVLLSSGEDAIVTSILTDDAVDIEYSDSTFPVDDLTLYANKENWEASELILVANGSFLLNESLVNKENRKLAGRLVDRCAGKKTVVFLESSYGGIPIKDRDPPSQITSSLAIFRVWPLNIILVHLAIVGVVFSIACWPIFGRPRHLKAASITNFGHHISALGSMLARTENRQFARAQIDDYHQAYKNEGLESSEPISVDPISPDSISPDSILVEPSPPNSISPDPNGDQRSSPPPA